MKIHAAMQEGRARLDLDLEGAKALREILDRAITTHEGNSSTNSLAGSREVFVCLAATPREPLRFACSQIACGKPAPRWFFAGVEYPRCLCDEHANHYRSAGVTLEQWPQGGATK